MVNRKSFLLLFFGIMAATSSIFSQSLIWSEDFTYPDGTTTGSGSSWTALCGACAAGDYFEVRNNQLHAVDVNDWSFWNSQSIDISTCTGTVEFSILAAETGDHEGPGCGCGVNIDYLDIYYSLDGGGFSVIPNWMGDGEPTHTLTGDSNNGVFDDGDWVSHTVVQTGLTGTSLNLRIELRNTSGTETMIIDDVVVNCTTPLDANELALSAARTGEAVLLQWDVLTTEGVDRYEIQRSLNGSSFTPAGTVPANQDHKVLSFSFSDPLSFGGSIFYRVREIHQNGDIFTSEILEVAAPDQKAKILSVYPNPVSDRVNIRFLLPEATALTFDLVDRMGRVIPIENGSFGAGNHETGFDLSGLSTGIYVLRLSGNGVNLSQQVSILK